ncbi:hypothetical protein HA464_19005 [Rhizobium leguminosarum bv. trifolii]|jgi:hypothetical protein|uniref:hypothetical protein n=1 Tax=Rhizobium ruizarguesonis TaxID=2081791 RepID=UPI0013E05793|nr:hypothetical protein [Rhizobium ruizarguesonis]QIO42511.1 hypothetical protein HA464_19005 [Rhizobium leguminosarum bv. trifolii]QND18850.1 hypothetical protein HB774_21700 [Rhizobium leguminosarum bv. viciae]MBC2806017.1 hypothetical protein [Rhizobium ruizarguesonis]MCB2402929.1 hypothetical protein [Rhizobium ruizarguesonis]QND37856.1 hypothetical protein HB771_29540 [Rhizobium leguminosarum bv. viciae]
MDEVAVSDQYLPAAEAAEHLLMIQIEAAAKNRYMQGHGIQVQMHWCAYFRAAGPLSPAGAVLCMRVRRAQQPTSLIE